MVTREVASINGVLGQSGTRLIYCSPDPGGLTQQNSILLLRLMCVRTKEKVHENRSFDAVSTEDCRGSNEFTCIEQQDRRLIFTWLGTA